MLITGTGSNAPQHNLVRNYYGPGSNYSIPSIYLASSTRANTALARANGLVNVSQSSSNATTPTLHRLNEPTQSTNSRVPPPIAQSFVPATVSDATPSASNAMGTQRQTIAHALPSPSNFRSGLGSYPAGVLRSPIPPTTVDTSNLASIHATATDMNMEAERIGRLMEGSSRGSNGPQSSRRARYHEGQEVDFLPRAFLVGMRPTFGAPK